MDTNKTYVLQCEKAVKIQEKWIPMRGDRVISIKKEKTQVIRFLHQEEADSMCGWKMGSRVIDKDIKVIFCPRQDQLQEMVEDKPYELCRKILRFWSDPPYYITNNLRHDYNTMEQLWLAFVMHEKYQKIWNGKDWVKNDRD